MDSKDWIHNIREIKKYNDEILSLKNGHWLVKDKISFLSKYASFFYDSHLDSIKTIALKVLSEINPMFDLKPEDRLVAAIHGKTQKYSPELRKGISETLAFLGVHGSKLINCTQHKPEITATLAIRELFKEADWKLWASLNDLLPVLAEAAPNEFITTVENAFKQAPCPFDELFSQEGEGGIMGTNYMTGLYWALETLAWSEEHLSRTILTLAELATHDPGGRWANRPKNSISTILLPWMPQTTATIDKRIASLKGIQRNFPEIAWKTLISLLPNQHQVSSGSYKPSFRKYIPGDWKQEVTVNDYWLQVREYAAMAVDIAKGSITHVSELVDNLDNIPQPSFNSILEYLSSDEVLRLPDEKKHTIWETMISFIKKHRRFSDSKWALPKEMVDSLDNTAKKLLPSNPIFLYKHLFSNKEYDFIEDDVDWQTQQGRMLDQRVEALRHIYKINKTSSVLVFSENVQNPVKVGNAFAHIANEVNDNELLPTLLNAQEQYKKQFISGYVWSRYHKEGQHWIDNLNTGNWSNEQKCNFLLFLPFEKEIWEKADDILKPNTSEYWKRIYANPFQTVSSLLPAIENLLKYGRSRLALDCIYAHYFLKKELVKELAIKALVNSTISDEPVGAMDPHHVTEIIKMLQNDPQISEDDLFSIEWAYLPLLNRHNNANPKLLEKHLSQRPDLFIEVIQLIYHSKNNDHKVEVDENKQKAALNAWKLLREWKRPPGKLDDGSFSSEALKKWVDEVKTKTIKSGHFEVAMTHLGHVLFYAGSDSNGLWIQQSAAEILDEQDNDHIRKGFSSEVFNSRGVHSVDPTGRPERELAVLWRKNALDVERLGLIRFASSLKNLANSYDHEAERVASEFLQEQENTD